MDQAVARETEETEEAGVPQSQEELPESESESGPGEPGEDAHSGSEMEEEEDEEDGEDWEEEEDMDGSMESEPEPDPIIFQLVRQGDLAAVSQILRSDRTAVHQRDGMDHTPIHCPCPSSMVMGWLGRDESPGLDMAKLLLSYGAPVNSKASGSYTPLHIACVTGREKMCNLLLSNGARYDLKLEDGRKTPLNSVTNLHGNGMEILKTFKRWVLCSLL